MEIASVIIRHGPKDSEKICLRLYPCISHYTDPRSKKREDEEHSKEVHRILSIALAFLLQT